MKKITLIIGFVICCIAGYSQFKSASLQASGLTCSMCSKAVKVALENVSFVKEVKVNIKTQEYALSFNENEDADFDLLKKAVEDAGFSVASLKVTGDFSDIIVQKDAHVQVDDKYFHFMNGSSQVLNGEKTLTIVDKDFVSAKDFKKYSASTKMGCIKTGKAENCCTKEGMKPGARIYHVII